MKPALPSDTGAGPTLAHTCRTRRLEAFITKKAKWCLPLPATSSSTIIYGGITNRMFTATVQGCMLTPGLSWKYSTALRTKWIHSPKNGSRNIPCFIRHSIPFRRWTTHHRTTKWPMKQAKPWPTCGTTSWITVRNLAPTLLTLHSYTVSSHSMPIRLGPKAKVHQPTCFCFMTSTVYHRKNHR